MDQLYLLALVTAIVVVMLAVARIMTKPRTTASQGAGGASGDSPIAVSTEGMKICPRCGMGNLWTERTCSACGSGLKG
jgi:hypothetical protein